MAGAGFGVWQGRTVLVEADEREAGAVARARALNASVATRRALSAPLADEGVLARPWRPFAATQVARRTATVS
jgi:hypothetical protein